MPEPLNSADYARIEAALHEVQTDIQKRLKRGETVHPKAVKAWDRTLDKIQRINESGKHTVQR